MLIAVRHGQTLFNENGKEKIRGWLPIPLTLEGMKAARETGEALERVEGVAEIFTSDLVRAVQTAEEIGQALSLPLSPVEELRDWNVGDLVGMDAKEAFPVLKAHMKDPDKRMEGGESYNVFLARSLPYLRELIEKKTLVIAVTHARICTMLSALCKTGGEDLDEATLLKPCPVDPSGFLIIRKDYKVVFQTKKEE